MNLWLRNETKPRETRTPIIPYHASLLTKLGYCIYVESSQTRIYSDEDYLAAGCVLVKDQSWQQADTNSYIIGVKELPFGNFPIHHKHIYFADAFERYGMEPLLKRFKSGGGILYDFEYMVSDIQGRVVDILCDPIEFRS